MTLPNRKRRTYVVEGVRFVKAVNEGPAVVLLEKLVVNVFDSEAVWLEVTRGALVLLVGLAAIE